MRKSPLLILTLAFAVPAGAAIWQGGDLSRFFAASASSGDLLQGCTDVPEAVALATELRDRALRIERYMEALETRKAEIATAEAALRARAAELRQQKSGIQSRRDGTAQAVREQLLPVVERYTALKRERELLDFGDVVALAAELARGCKQVRELERSTSRVVLLDEYQDTGAAQ